MSDRRLTTRLRVTACLGVSLLAAVVGCGDGLGRVRGAVTLDGEPVVKTGDLRCYVSFTPASTAGVPATGSVDEGGEFRLAAGAGKGLAPGDYLAAVRITRVTPPETAGGYSSSEVLSDPRFSNPQTSGLRFTVAPGGNRFDIPVESGAGS